MHYMIRFENTGTASAINVVVKDIIDIIEFDISTLIPLKGSHNFVTRISNNNTVEFIFENINLPEDDANNDGYVTFKIKTQPTLVLGDTFSNTAEIYFDFNAPIITNTAVTTVANSLSVSNYELDSSIKLYPNPVDEELHIESKNILETISVYDINGRVLYNINVVENQFNETLNIDKLTKGVYFVRVTSAQGEFVEKIIKE
ncbi:T9SS type A sorting domain-containing protein [Lacinutrix neustonica]|uniref:T9SS type A sorting domain-containing protein n=1 Tax=Lacinutrix neustonica TaxID=2980107 RepID=A0A9E8SER8_9FLAO|nr:T9SS type A sorting domain-containing protein [Lacinutrix neustonica]WAC03501.1 T9SS type A sorting domain-containing protein [Lacinutrix neustonica]